MPLKLEITLDGNSFKAEGDFVFDDQFSKALSQFINAISEQPNQVQTLADQLNTQQDRLQAAVDTNTLPKP